MRVGHLIVPGIRGRGPRAGIGHGRRSGWRDAGSTPIRHRRPGLAVRAGGLYAVLQPGYPDGRLLRVLVSAGRGVQGRTSAFSSQEVVAQARRRMTEPLALVAET